jgi:hypothetical protein
MGSYLICKKKNLGGGANHPVVFYRNMRILRSKLRCDTAHFKPCLYAQATVHGSATVAPHTGPLVTFNLVHLCCD